MFHYYTDAQNDRDLHADLTLALTSNQTLMTLTLVDSHDSHSHDSHSR